MVWLIVVFRTFDASKKTVIRLEELGDTSSSCCVLGHVYWCLESSLGESAWLVLFIAHPPELLHIPSVHTCDEVRTLCNARFLLTHVKNRDVCSGLDLFFYRSCAIIFILSGIRLFGGICWTWSGVNLQMCGCITLSDDTTLNYLHYRLMSETFYMRFELMTKLVANHQGH